MLFLAFALFLNLYLLLLQGVRDRMRSNQTYVYVPSPGHSAVGVTHVPGTEPESEDTTIQIESHIPANQENGTLPVYTLPPGPNDWPHNRNKPPNASRDYLDSSIRENILMSVRSLLNRHSTNYNMHFTVKDLAMALRPNLSSDYPSLKKTLGAIYLQPDYVQEPEVDSTLYRELYQLLEDKAASYILRQQGLVSQRTLNRTAVPGLEGFSSVTLDQVNTLDSDRQRVRPRLDGFSIARLNRDGRRSSPSRTDIGMQRYLQNMRDITGHQPGESSTPTAPPETADSTMPPPSYHSVASNVPPSAPQPPNGEEGEPLVNSDVPDAPPPSYDQVMNWS